jgi:hypothetical protein
LPVQTPTLQPRTEPDRVVQIPEAEEPQTRILIVLLALALVAAMALGGGIVYAWEQGRIRDSNRAAHAAAVDAVGARDEAAAVLARVGALQAQVTGLDIQLKTERTNRSILEGKNADAAGQAQRALDRMGQVQAQLNELTGPAVPNGRHIAYLLSADATQSPPMIVIDLGRWFTGDAARRAATADGALAGGRHLVQGRYLRNSGHDWRILPVSTSALFTIRHYNGLAGESHVSLTTLVGIMSGTGPANVRIAHDPFWVEVKNGVIGSGREQAYRAP